ncbi:MAG: hypothetical protein AB8F34_15420 [Akkermansiaceae bacterium]
MDSQATSKPLRFGCPACGIRLVVDQSIAGTEGPCPSCGARIVAPPVEVANSLVEKKAAPVAIKPRSAKSQTSEGSGSSGGDLATSAKQTVPEPVSKSQSRRRSVSPNSIVSDKHSEKQNTLIFLKILVAVLVVIAIAIGTYFILKNAS